MIFFFIALSTYFCYLILKTIQNLELLQKQKFDISKCFKWTKEHLKKILLTSDILAIILIALALNIDAKAMGICMIVFYMFMFLYRLKDDGKKIKFNSNMIRTGIITLIIYILILIGCVWNYNSVSSEFIMVDNRWIYFIVMIVAIYINYFIVLLSGLINNGIMFIVRKFKDKKSLK
ncbi:MAG: hypothetical protein HFH47_02545 [Bacilli bacterium]|nr:hypothetical protein [Bacilli bacterium]